VSLPLLLGLGQAAAADHNPGDTRQVEFVLPVQKAAEQATALKLLFLKPIYGGVSQEGYRDYRAGSW